MAGATVEYDALIALEDKELIESRRDLFITAYSPRSLRWTVALDSKNRKYFRVFNRASMNDCLGQFVPNDLRHILSEEDFKGQIMDGQFPCKTLS